MHLVDEVVERAAINGVAVQRQRQREQPLTLGRVEELGLGDLVWHALEGSHTDGPVDLTVPPFVERPAQREDGLALELWADIGRCRFQGLRR